MASSEQSPRRLRDLRDAVEAFLERYERYREVTLGSEPDDEEARRLRSELNHLMATTQDGLVAAGLDLVVYPPAATGGPPYSGLRNVAFLHERPGWRRAGITSRVQDALETAIAELERRAELEAHRRRNPLYWGDRILQAVLGFPAYLVSLVFRVPLNRIEESPLGTPLRLLGLVLEGLGVYFGGRAAGWW